MDTDHRILLINEPALTFLHTTRDAALGNPAENIPHPLVQSEDFRYLLTPTDPPSIAEQEIRISFNGNSVYFHIKRVPAVFEDASRGITIIIEDITGKKAVEAWVSQHMAQLEFLARTSAELADMGDEEDLFQYIADRLSELEPGAYVMVNSINPDRMETALRAFSRDETLKDVVNRYFGIFVKGGVSMEKLPPQMLDGVSKGILSTGPAEPVRAGLPGGAGRGLQRGGETDGSWYQELCHGMHLPHGNLRQHCAPVPTGKGCAEPGDHRGICPPGRGCTPAPAHAGETPVGGREDTGA